MWLGLDIWTSCHWGVAVCGWDWTYGLAAIGGSCSYNASRSSYV